MSGFSFPSEIYKKIFENLDSKSLSSSILVNRVWCLNSVNILWRDPFAVLGEIPLSNFQSRTISIIQSYVCCLSREVKLKLISANVPIDKLNVKRPTFEYTSFLRSLHHPDLYNSIGSWLAQEDISIRNGFQHILLMNEMCKLFFTRCRELKALDFSGVPEISYLIHHRDVHSNKIFFCLPGVIPFLSNLQYFSCEGNILFIIRFSYYWLF